MTDPSRVYRLLCKKCRFHWVVAEMDYDGPGRCPSCHHDELVVVPPAPVQEREKPYWEG